MRSETIPEPGISYAPVRYGASRLVFRGPKRALDGRHVAFVGGSDTYGRSVAEPFPALIEEVLGEACVNLGQVNASIDVAVNDPVVLEACRDAALTVVEVTGAGNMSNRFYQVHPRRNDRLTRVSTVMQAVFPDVDFSEFCFTRHMLGHLLARAPDRFPILREELQAAWAARMRTFLDGVGTNVVLLWLSPHLPSDAPWEERPDPLLRDPLFVTRRMVDALRPRVHGVVMVRPPGWAAAEAGAAAAASGEGGPWAPAQAARALGPAGHREAAAALTGVIRSLLLTQGAVPGVA
jgi:hypothetical protein